MERIEKKADIGAAETKILASVAELSLAGVAPSFPGLLHFLRGEGLGLRYDGLFLCGGYPSMGNKRLGKLLSNLKRLHLLDGSFEEDGTEYYFLTLEGKEIAEAYLRKPHARRRPPRRAPLEFLPLDR